MMQNSFVRLLICTISVYLIFLELVESIKIEIVERWLYFLFSNISYSYYIFKKTIFVKLKKYTLMYKL